MLFKIAMDYLPIQASSVPCKWIFSSSAETNTKKRNRIGPLLMETLQMLKFHIKKERLSFTKDWITPDAQMLQDELDDDLLDLLLRGNPASIQDGLNYIIQTMDSFPGIRPNLFFHIAHFSFSDVWTAYWQFPWSFIYGYY